MRQVSDFLSFRPLSVAVFLASLAPLLVLALSDDLKLPPDLSGHDKAMHATGFFVLAFALMAGARRAAIMAAAALLLAFAFALEWAQPLLTATREASLKDFAASAAGVVMGAMAAIGANAAAGRVLSRRV